MTFMDILWVLRWILGLLLIVCYAYQALYLFLPLLKREKPWREQKLHRYGVLIAARNEELVLPHLLESIRNQDYPAELVEVFVVADNCTDRTAQVARQMGASVFVRENRQRVGKGYALHDLLQWMDHAGDIDRLDAFLVFDADNLLQVDYITQINKVCSAGYDAFCGYRNTKNFGTNWISASHAIWFIHESVHLNHSRMLLGNPCKISGTGFGFTRQLLRRCGGWNFFTLTEDIEFGTWCTIRNVRIGYNREAMFYDEQPESLRMSWRQRTRWTQGNVQVSVRYGLDLFRGMLRGGRIGYNCMETATLSMWGYGMSAFTALLTLVLLLTAGGWAAVGVSLLLGLAGAYLSGMCIAAITLFTEHRRIRATIRQKWMAVFAFPLYMLTSIPIAATALFRKFHWPPIEHSVAISANQFQS